MTQDPLKRVVDRLNRKKFHTATGIDHSTSPLSQFREQMRDSEQHYDPKRPLGRLVMSLTEEEDAFLTRAYGPNWHEHWKDISDMYPELGTLGRKP